MDHMCLLASSGAELSRDALSAMKHWIEHTTFTTDLIQDHQLCDSGRNGLVQYV